MSDARISFLAAIYPLINSASTVILTAPLPLNGPSSVLASQRVFPTVVGCGISRAVRFMRCASDGDPYGFHREPDDEVSVLRYATAWREIQEEKSSTHSVLPINPYYGAMSAITISKLVICSTSSPSQLANITGRSDLNN
jgi:hypothetical protein